MTHARSLVFLVISAVSTVPPLSAGTLFQFGSAGQEYGKAIATDSSNNVYVAGLFQNTINVNPDGAAVNMSASGASVDTVIAKYNSNGDYQWSTHISGLGTKVPHGVLADSSGNVYVTGYFGQSGAVAGPGNNATFDPTGTIAGRTVSSQGGFDAYVAKYNTSGVFQWAIGLGNAGQTTEERGWDISLDTNNNVLVSGGFSGTVNFNPLGTANNLTAASTVSHFVSRYDSSGVNNLALKLDANLTDVFTEAYTAVAPDSSGGFYVAGNYRGTTDFGSGTTRTSAGQSDVFMAHYNSSGTLLGVASVGGANTDILSPGAMRVGSDGNLYMTGRFTGPSDFNPGASVTTLVGSNDVWVSAYNPDLTLRWAFAVPVTGTGIAGGHRVAFDSDGNLWVAGWINGGTADFDPSAATFPLTATSANGDWFLAKYTSGGVLLWARTFGATDGSAQNIAAGLALDSQNNAWVTGQFYGTNLDFAPGADTALLSSLGLNDLFVAKYTSIGYLSAAPEPGRALLLCSALVVVSMRRQRPRLPVTPHS